MSSSRYNLRPIPSRPFPGSIKKARRRVRKPRRQPKRDPPVAATKSKTMAIPAPSPSIGDSRRLYEKPNMWMQDHLRIANLQLKSDVPIDEIVNVKYIPSDEDIGKFALANEEPTHSDMSTLRISTDSRTVPRSFCGGHGSIFYFPGYWRAQSFPLFLQRPAQVQTLWPAVLASLDANLIRCTAPCFLSFYN